MRSAFTVEAVPLRASAVPLVVLEVSRLPRSSDLVRPHSAMTFETAHAAASRHRHRQTDADSCHVLFAQSSQPNDLANAQLPLIPLPH